MNFKKILGVMGIVIAVSLLVLVGFQFISWFHFWIAIALLAVFAYLVLPRISD